MKRGTIQQRLCRLEDQVSGLLAKRPIPALQVATREELVKILALLDAKGRKVKISSETTPELWALFETLNKRLIATLRQE